ncbi:SDR family oxidoreductase [Leptospira ognonensis]|uniref:SDR family oxidoreductase n=1 Tax=Leptospira ognonensis TaxID=2484945 RepID=A0A4R9K3E8_9LEPT|nr:SDR family oxidoreductase [Leptospira ognonensis]TGL59761.1 SDR family oxidoreductase [Leptospira ognonensis]
MKIVVTGALGHIGSSFIRVLPEHFSDLKIILIDNLMTQRYCSLFNLPNNAEYEFIDASLENLDLSQILDHVDYVIHLAAITDAAGSFGKAELVEKNNLSSTKLVAEACAKSGAKLITLSSTSVYGTSATLVDENCSAAELKPQSPYAITKLKEEEFVQSLVKSSGLKASILRFGTIYGVSPGMRFHTAVNKFCWQASFNQPITVWRTAYDQLRPYLDLRDACRALVHIIKTDLFDGEIYNVLTKNITVREVVDCIKEFKYDLTIHFVDNQIMNQLSYEVASKKFETTGFVFNGDIRKGIGETMALLGNRTNGNR